MQLCTKHYNLHTSAISFGSSCSSILHASIPYCGLFTTGLAHSSEHCSRQMMKMWWPPIQSLPIVTLLSAPLARAYILNYLLNNSILLLSQAQGRDLELGWGELSLIHRRMYHTGQTVKKYRGSMMSLIDYREDRHKEHGTTCDNRWFIDRCYRVICNARWWWHIVPQIELYINSCISERAYKWKRWVCLTHGSSLYFWYKYNSWNKG